MRADLLGETFARSGATVLYLQPTFANPTGAVLAQDRRAAVLDAARRAGAFVLEDDWARYLPLDGPAPPPLLQDDVDGHVVHLSSLSKANAPSLRIGRSSREGRRPRAWPRLASWTTSVSRDRCRRRRSSCSAARRGPATWRASAGSCAAVETTSWGSSPSSCRS